VDTLYYIFLTSKANIHMNEFGIEQNIARNNANVRRSSILLEVKSKGGP
jgi:hypothetical protein